MDRFIYIRNAEDDAYMNTSANFRGMEQASSGVVIMYFESPITSSVGANAYDKITLAVTANSEKQAMIDIGGALAGAKSGTTAVIADDYGTAYCSDLITSGAGVTTISKATGGSTANVITVGSTDTTLLAGQSGSIVNINHAAVTVTLPAAQAGLNFRMVLGIDTTSGAEILTASNADCFYGTIQLFSTHGTADQVGQAHQITHATAVAAPASYDAIKFVAATNTIGGVAGEVWDFVAVDDTAWLATCDYHATSDAAPGDMVLFVAR